MGAAGEVEHVRRMRSDRELVRAMRKKGSDAFDVLFYRYAETVHAYAASITDEPKDVDDVLQDVFVLAWSKLDTKRMPGESVLPWLLSTARNIVLSTNRAQTHQRTVPLGEATGRADDNVQRSMSQRESSAVLHSALSKLSSLDRRIVELCLADGLTYKEAARVTRTSTATVRNRLSRARRMLRGEIAAEMGDGDGR